MLYKEYLGNTKEILKKYELYEENQLEENFSLCKACLKADVSQHFCIYKEIFPDSPANLARLTQFLNAYENGLFLIEKPLLLKYENALTLFFITPMQDRGEIFSYKSKSPNFSKLQFFGSLLQTVKKFHDLRIPYLQLTPSNIFFKLSEVCLSPFRIMPDLSYESNFYSSPELIAGIAYLSTQFPADIWALGCIYAELFISITPLFQAVTAYERLLKMFSVLGIPEWRFVEKYMTWETYKGLKALTNNTIKDVVFEKKDENTSFVLNLLQFDTEIRPNIHEIIAVWAQTHKETLSESVFSSTKNLSFKENSFEGREEESIEIDNFLNITLHQIKGLKVFETNSENMMINVAYEILLHVPVHAVSDNFSAKSKIELNFTQRFHINSDEFKSKYRHQPILVNFYQCMKNLNKKSRDTLLGSSEIYIGLLFSTFGNSEKNDNSVYGWYNIMDGNRIIGQVLVEIFTDLSFNKNGYGVSVTNYEENNFSVDSIKGISDDLQKLNQMLSEKSVESDVKEKM